MRINFKRSLKKFNNFIACLFRDFGAIIIFGIILLSLTILLLIGDIKGSTVKLSLWHIVLVITIILLFLFVSWILHLIYKKHPEGPERGLFNVKTFQAGMAWTLPLLGFLGYALAYLNIVNGEGRDIIIKISDLLVIGGVVGFLTNASHFFGIFKEELRSIIYSDNYLSIRKDIPMIWDKVSAEMLERRFPDIHTELFSIIKEHYFCKHEYSYYDGYRILSDITWADNQHSFIIITDYIHFDLVTEKKGKVDLSFWACCDEVQGLELDKDFYCNVECFVNDIKRAPDKVENGYDDEILKNKYTWKHVIEIDNESGKGVYSIKVIRRRRCRLLTDHDLSFRSKYIIRDMVVSISLPPDLHATFLCRGTPNDFIIVKNDETNKEFIYKGLILQRQGFIFALHKKV